MGFRIGQQVRVITLNGCMAHVRDYSSVVRARIVNLGSLPEPYPSAHRYDGVELEDMETGARVWRPRWGWVERHGIMEYQI